MKLVSRCWINTRMKDISLRVFSKMIRGSSDWQRRQLGAITMAKLLTSILVTATLAGCTNTCRRGEARPLQEVGVATTHPVLSGKGHQNVPSALLGRIKDPMSPAFRFTQQIT